MIPPLSIGFVRIYYSILNLISTVIIGAFAFKIGSKHGSIQAAFAVASVLAIASNCTTLGVGQYGTILTSLLILFFWCLEKRQESLAGILGGIALLKPNFTALFLLIPLTKKRYRVVLGMAAYTVLASLIVAIAVRENPLKMVWVTLKSYQYFADHGNSAISILTSAGLPIRLAISAMTTAGIGLSILLLIRFNNASLLTQFAIACVIGRLWAYHRNYDNIMLAFLYMAMLKLMLTKPNIWNVSVLFLVGISLWMPESLYLSGIIYIQYMVWIGSLVFLLMSKYQKPVVSG